jgi:predicted DCC family thiol-disulfide oxidoreductase YuxK
LCHGTVKFIIRHDRDKRFSFTTWQSVAGQEVLTQLDITTNPSTVVYVRKGVPYFKSRAVLEILKDLGNGWKLFYILIVVPPFIRDFIYGIIARYRYRVFGKRTSCK